MQKLPDLAAAVQVIAAAPRQGHRRLVALTGGPASGKSTTASRLSEALTASGCETCVLPMDGFHLDNRILDTRQLRLRKGAPETFDVAGFAALLARVVKPGEVVHPVFDRARDCAIAGAGVIPLSCDTVVIEGNYLMLRTPGWEALAALWDVTIALDPPLETLRKRLTERWLGLGHSAEEATRRTDGNDMVNAALIAAQSAPSAYSL
jgi:fructokinase